MKLSSFAQKHADVFWDVPKESVSVLSDETIFERFLSYGQWGDLKKIHKLLGEREKKTLFKKIAYKPRSNLHPATISFFADYYGVKK